MPVPAGVERSTSEDMPLPVTGSAAGAARAVTKAAAATKREEKCMLAVLEMNGVVLSWREEEKRTVVAMRKREIRRGTAVYLYAFSCHITS